MRKGIRFPNPCAVPSDDSFQSFLHAHNTTIHNTFPELIDTTTTASRHIAWSNPLISLWYVPTTDGESLYEELKTLSEDDVSLFSLSASTTNAAAIHETSHLILNFTPAKDYARLWLATAYSCLIPLGVNDNWDFITSVAWKLFENSCQFAEDVFHQIAFSEELLVTLLSTLVSCTIADNFDFIAPTSTERQIIDAQAQVFGESFYELYYDIRANFVRLGFGGYPNAKELHSSIKDELTRKLSEYVRKSLILLTIYVQSITPTDAYLAKPVDGIVRLRTVLAAMKHMRNPVELFHWLQHEITYTNSKDLREWNLLIDMTLKNDPDDVAGGLAFRLWKRCGGGYKYNDITGDSSAAQIILAEYLQGQHRAPGGNILLYPKRLGERWIIAQYDSAGALIADETAEDWEWFIWGESLRQQINMRQGIVCPFFDGTYCCGGSDVMQRLTTRALEGRFGDGNWADLPEPCKNRR